MKAQENVSFSEISAGERTFLPVPHLLLDLLKFENSYSWTRSKEIFYSVKVLPPESELSEATPTQTAALAE